MLGVDTHSEMQLDGRIELRLAGVLDELRGLGGRVVPAALDLLRKRRVALAVLLRHGLAPFGPVGLPSVARWAPPFAGCAVNCRARVSRASIREDRHVCAKLCRRCGKRPEVRRYRRPRSSATSFALTSREARRDQSRDMTCGTSPRSGDGALRHEACDRAGLA